MSTITFCRPADPNGHMSNFFVHPVPYMELNWKSSEHLFQAAKFLGNIKDQQDVFDAATPRDAAAIGRDRSRPIRPDWEEVKDNVMRMVVALKYGGSLELTMKLLSTGDAELVEYSTKDRYWGNGGDGSGKNMLGKILMEVRQVLKEQMTLRNSFSSFIEEYDYWFDAIMTGKPTPFDRYGLECYNLIGQIVDLEGEDT